MANGKVDLSDEGFGYLTAEEEEEKIIAQGNALLNEDGTFVRDKVKSRQDADYPVVAPDEVELMTYRHSRLPLLQHL